MLAFIAHTCHAAAAAPPAGTGPVAHNSADEDDAEDEAGGRDDEDEGGAKEGGLLDDEHDGEGGEVGDELDKVREPAEAEEEAPARAPPTRNAKPTPRCRMPSSDANKVRSMFCNAVFFSTMCARRSVLFAFWSCRLQAQGTYRLQPNRLQQQQDRLQHTASLRVASAAAVAAPGVEDVPY